MDGNLPRKTRFPPGFPRAGFWIGTFGSEGTGFMRGIKGINGK
jgi:hypothetical protein